MLHRGGQARVTVMEDRSWTSMNIPIQDNIEAGSHLFTDEANAYFGLRADYVHEFINHAEAYVRGMSILTAGELLEPFEARPGRNVHQCRTVPPVPLHGRTGVSLQPSQGNE